MLGRRKDLDKLNHLMATAAGWGGNLPQDAVYDGGSTERNDGLTPHSLTVRNVPIKDGGFWSVMVYNQTGFMEPCKSGVVSINNKTAIPNADGSVTINFSNSPTDDTLNCISIMPGWRYAVRLYCPLQSILDRSWTFPVPAPCEDSHSRL